MLSGSGEKPLLHWMEFLQIHDCVPKNKPKECLTVCVGDVRKRRNTKMTKNVPLCMFVLVLHLIETTAMYKPCLWLLAQMTGCDKAFVC